MRAVSNVTGRTPKLVVDDCYSTGLVLAALIRDGGKLIRNDELGDCELTLHKGLDHCDLFEKFDIPEESFFCELSLRDEQRKLFSDVAQTHQVSMDEVVNGYIGLGARIEFEKYFDENVSFYSEEANGAVKLIAFRDDKPKIDV